MTNARANRPPPRPPPTLGTLRGQGVRWIHVSCTFPNCLQLDTLGLPDDLPFPAVATRRRWVCAKCGCRKVHVMPRWPAR